MGGNTDLQGAVIGSEATPDKNKLDTGTLTWSDIENEAEYKATSSGIGFGISKDGKVSLPTPTPSIPVSDDADSTTKAAISPGTIIVRDNPNQDLSGLSRDPQDALNKLDKIFDKKTVQEKQELANLFGQEAFNAVGDLAESMWKDAKTPEEKAKWAEGGEYKILLHALVSGMMSEISGGGFSSGAVGGGFTQAAQALLANINDPNVRLIASGLIGAVAAKLVGGDALIGGTVGYYGTRYNDYVHHPTKEGSYIFVKGKGFYQIINGVDTYMQDAVPPAGAVVWYQDPANEAYGNEYIQGDSGHTLSDTYFVWKNVDGIRVASYGENGPLILVNGKPFVNPEDAANSPYKTWLVQSDYDFMSLDMAKWSLQYKGIDPNDPNNAYLLAEEVQKQIQSKQEMLEGMTGSVGGPGFKTFKELKAFLGSPGAGNQWHHIVEQAQINASRAGFAAEEVNSVENIIALQSGKESVHSAISAYYSRKFDWTGELTVRDWLATKSFQEQFEFGMNFLKNYGQVIKENGMWIFKPFE